MKFAIMGAGGLGALYGGLLARAGETVHFIARRAHLEALRNDGLHVESPHVGDFHLPAVDATDDPGTLGPVDVVLMGVKAYDLDSASEAIRPLLGPETYVVPLLNGADIAERIGAVIGPERVLGGTVFASSNVMAPGRVRHVLNAPFLFGELAGGRSARGDALESVLRAAGANARQSEDIRADVWRKFVFVAALAGASSVTRLATKDLVTDPDTRRLFVDTMTEVAALARALDMALEPDLVDRHLALADEMNPLHTVSMLLDLRAGRRLELDIFQRTVVRLGEELGVPTPVNRVLYAALKPSEHGAPA